MKYMNMKEKYGKFDLQLFADDNGGGGNESEEGDDQDDDTDEDGDDEDEEERRFSQREVDEAIKKRLAREKRKWKREQQRKSSEEEEHGEKSGDNGKEDKETQELRDKAAKAEHLELKWTCLEHDVDKDCVDDVLALARVYMAKDEDVDIEDAIDEVIKKYPQFKKTQKDEEEEKETKTSWGQRQTGRGSKKMTGVEAKFYDMNPDLK